MAFPIRRICDSLKPMPTAKRPVIVKRRAPPKSPARFLAKPPPPKAKPMSEPAKPETKPAPPPPPKPPEQPPAPQAALPIGAKPTDEKDPQAVKFKGASVPPGWTEFKEALKIPEWLIKPEREPLGHQHPPKGWPADDMTSPEEQRARSAWIEAKGMFNYLMEVDERKG